MNKTSLARMILLNGLTYLQQSPKKGWKMLEKIRSKTFLILMKIIEAQIQETPK